jgi:Uncharacterized protein conserved in bacteria
MGNTKRGLWIGIAFLMMGAGAVGVVLPILPTVPFLMAALYCFARGSHKTGKLVSTDFSLSKAFRTLYG